MKPEDFQKYLDLYGSDLDRWPDGVQDSAKSALAHMEPLQILYAEAQRMETWLRSENLPDPSPNLNSRIIAATHGVLQERPFQSERTRLGDWFRGLWRPQVAFAMVLLLLAGFSIGYFSNMDVSSSNSGTELASLLYNDEAILWATNSN